MTSTMLKNYCIEPETRSCSCSRRLCGGILTPRDECLEHGTNAALPVVMKTHIHPIQGPPVGTYARSRYDDAKAS